MSLARPCRFGALVALLALILAAPAMAQTGEDVLRHAQRDPGASARMVGLAGAGVAGVADWGATVANPAGLGLVRRSHVTSSIEVSSVGNQVQDGTRFTTRSSRLGPGHAAYVYRVPTARGSLVLGAGYHQTAILDRTLFFEAPAAQGTLAGEIYERGWMGEVSGVAAFEVVPRVHVGAALNIPVGEYRLEQFGGPGRLELTTAVRGVNLRGGLVAEAVPGIRLGLALETPTWLYAEDRFAQGASLSEYYNYTMQTPWRVAAGIAYDIGDLLVAADVGFADWGQTRLRPTAVYADANRAALREFRETLDLRLGAEYDFGVGAVRGGYAFAHDPLRDHLEADRTRHTFGAGFSFYAYPGITLDLGVSLTEFQDQYFPAHAAQPVRESVGALRVLGGIQVNI